MDYNCILDYKNELIAESVDQVKKCAYKNDLNEFIKKSYQYHKEQL